MESNLKKAEAGWAFMKATPGMIQVHVTLPPKELSTESLVPSGKTRSCSPGGPKVEPGAARAAGNCEKSQKGESFRTARVNSPQTLG